MTCLSRASRFMLQTALSAKSSSTLANPVTVLPFTRYSPVTQLGKAKQRGSVAKRTRDFFPLVEFHKFSLQVDRFLIRKHRTLAACADDGIKFVHIDFRNFLCVLRQRKKFRCGQESHANQVAGGVTAGIAWITHGICFTFAAVRAEHLHLISLFR